MSMNAGTRYTRAAIAAGVSRATERVTAGEAATTLICGFSACWHNDRALGARLSFAYPPATLVSGTVRDHERGAVIEGTVVEGISITVIGGLLVLVIVGVWNRRGSPRRWFQQQRQIANVTERENAGQELGVLREQVLEVARARKIVIPASSRGINPTSVVFSDGSTRIYFRDQASYVRAMQAGQVPATRTFRSAPPVPLSRWTREVVEQWLADNAD